MTIALVQHKQWKSLPEYNGLWAMKGFVFIERHYLLTKQGFDITRAYKLSKKEKMARGRGC